MQAGIIIGLLFLLLKDNINMQFFYFIYISNLSTSPKLLFQQVA